MPHHRQHYDILDADTIERVDVPDSKRTDQKDDAATTIDEMWPATLTDIATEAGYSRQHIRNTLDLYFRPASHSTITVPLPDGDALQEDVQLPGHEQELLAAYRMGYRDGRHDARNHDR